ncbi:MAG: restriction endonuclease subunit R, partial [Bacteroidetes bacterium]|nr:restriction endonuclease subunit R [Bacteroidota bacterium]
MNEYVDGKVFRGVLTGLNEAFVIDRETKDRLIKQDKRSAEVIKPFLTGREIKKYQYPAGEKYLIFFPKGFTNKKGKKPSNAWKWLTDNYSSIAAFLKPFEAAGKKRFDKGDYWWELRACDYYDEFENPKIIYPNILKQPEFTFDVDKRFANQKCFVIPVDDKYLLGFLNSKLNHYLFEK